MGRVRKAVVSGLTPGIQQPGSRTCAWGCRPVFELVMAADVAADYAELCARHNSQERRASSSCRDAQPGPLCPRWISHPAIGGMGPRISEPEPSLSSGVVLGSVVFGALPSRVHSGLRTWSRYETVRTKPSAVVTSSRGIPFNPAL